MLLPESEVGAVNLKTGPQVRTARTSPAEPASQPLGKHLNKKNSLYAICNLSLFLCCLYSLAKVLSFFVDLFKEPTSSLIDFSIF